MKTAKALGFKKGDCVRVVVGTGFVGVIMSDAHTATPCCEIWGFAHEGGSVYAEHLVKITPAQLKEDVYYKQDPHPFSAEGKKALA